MTQTHELPDGGWVVSVNDQWLPGVYDSDATARRAAELPDERLVALGTVYRVDGENRFVTAADLDQEGRIVTKDQLRERLAEALWKASGEPAELVPFHKLSAVHQDEYRRMVPVVREYAAQRAAEELRRAAHFLDDGDTQAIEVALGGAAYVNRVLCDRAAAMDAAREQQP